MEKTDKIKNKDRRIGIRVDEKSFITLNKIADKKKISFSELVRLAIESYIKKWLVNVLKNIEVKREKPD